MAAAFVEKFCSPDFVAHFSRIPKDYHPADYAELLSAFHAGVPDFESEIHDVVIEGDRAAVFETICYTHTGEFVGLPPTGNKVEYQQMSFWRLADGKAQEAWVVYDSRTNWEPLMHTDSAGEGISAPT